MLKNMMRIVAAVALLTACSEQEKASSQQAANMTIISAQNGTVSEFVVENAVTPEELQKGLMYRESLEPGHGMAFNMKGFEHVGMWMKNTQIPLDMVFAKDGKVIWVYKNAKPLSEETITSPEPADVVIEINAGEADKYNIQPGDTIKHAFFGNEDTKK